MNRLNRNVEYALIALNHMEKCNHDQLFSVKQLADHMKAPFDSLSRVMQKLSKQSLIQSEQGKAGGYRLACDFSQVSLYDLIKTIQGPVEIVKCLSDSEDCFMESSCDLKSPVTFLNSKLIEFYKTITIEELLNQNSVIKEAPMEVLAP